MDKTSSETQKNIGRLIEPELTLAKPGEGTDPRLVNMVRLLARRAARELYEKQMRERRTKPS